MRLVIALGGNALLRRGEAMTAENQRENVRIACEQIAKVAPGNELVIAHGNGPQVGLLALQGAAYEKVTPQGLQVLQAGQPALIAADTVVLCAGQLSERGLADALIAAGRQPHVIGGADVAAELDAKRAIDQGTRLAATL